MRVAHYKNVIVNFFLVVFFLFNLTRSTDSVSAAGTCGTGTWIPGNLEIHHIDIGQGDSALIVGPTGKSLLLDAGETNWNSSAKAQIIGPYIESVLGCRSLDYVLISHFHLDHIGYVGYGGLWNLVESQGFTVGTTLVRDYNTYLGSTSGTFTNWKTYLEGAGQPKIHPVTAVEGTGQVDLGAAVTFKIVALDGNGALIAGNFSGDASPPSENDYSIGAVLSYGNFDEWLGGDLDGEYETSGFGYTYHDIELSAAPEVGDVDVYKANHHGSSHSSSATFINELDPEVSILSLGNGNTYGHPAQTTMDRLLATSTVYLTERGELSTNIGSAIVAGNIVIKTSNGTNYTVNGTPYLATEPVRSDMDGDGYFAEADPNDNNSSLVPAPNGGCGPSYQTCSVSTSCQITIGQVVINEVLPAPASGPEWVELYNTTSSTLDLGYCVVDDIVGGSPAYHIPAGTLIPTHGFWTLDQTTYFNNTGDDVRFLSEDASTVLDTFTYGNTGSNLSWYRLPDGGSWAGSPTASTTKGQSNTLPFYPIVFNIARLDNNPSDTASVAFTVTFSKTVTGVNMADFTLTTTGVTSASITNVSGSGSTYTVIVNTGTGNGTIRLDVMDDDSIQDTNSHPLGGVGLGNGNFIAGETYTIEEYLVDITIGGNPMGSYSLGISESTRPSYASIDSGPVRIESTNGIPIVAGLNEVWKNNGVATSSFQVMAMPSTLLSNKYVFPAYNNVTLNEQLRFGNVGSADTTVTVTIGGQVQGSYLLHPNEQKRENYAGIDSGPVVVEGSDPNVPIIAALRDAWFTNNLVESFSQLMGLPSTLLSNKYVFAAYNNITLNEQLRFGNVGNADTIVTVTIAGQVMGSYLLHPSEQQRVNYPVDNGPVVVEGSDPNVPIIAAIRSAWFNGSVVESWVQLMGLPASQVSNKYVFPAYDNVNVSGQLRLGNIGNADTTVTVTIGGNLMGSYLLHPSEQKRVNYPLDSGPVVVEGSDPNVPIIAALRDALFVNNVVESFTQVMGLPASQLSDTFLLPAYNNVTLSEELRFGVP